MFNNVGAPPVDPNAPPPQVQPTLADPAVPNQGQQTMPVQGSPVTGQPNPAVVQKNATGHAFHSIVSALGGDSSTSTPTRRLFGSILAGAMLGAGAGADDKTGSGWQSGGKGASAVIQNLQGQRNLYQARADRLNQQQQENQLAQNREDRETQLMHATIAQMQAESAARQHTSDLQDKEFHDKHNAASEALYNGLKDAGGVPPVDGKLPDNLTAADLSAAYSKDPSVRMAPQGYTRHFLDKTDSSEVTWNGTNWTHPDGTPANMTDKTSVQVVDVPDDAMRTRRNVSGADLNKLVGQSMFDGSKTYKVAPLDMIGLNNNRLKTEAEDAKSLLENRQGLLDIQKGKMELQRLKKEGENIDKQAFLATYKDLNESISTARQKLKDEGLMMSPEDKKQVEGQINDLEGELTSTRKKLFPETKLTGDTSGSAPKVAHPEVVGILNQVPGFDPAIARQIGNLTPDQIANQLASSKLSLDVKNKILASVGKPPIKPPQPAPQGGDPSGGTLTFLQNAAQNVANKVAQGVVKQSPF